MTLHNQKSRDISTEMIPSFKVDRTTSSAEIEPNLLDFDKPWGHGRGKLSYGYSGSLGSRSCKIKYNEVTKVNSNQLGKFEDWMINIQGNSER